MVVVPTVDGNGLLHVALDLQCSLLALLQSQLVPNFPHGLVDFFLGLGILLVALSLESGKMEASHMLKSGDVGDCSVASSKEHQLSLVR